MIQREHTTTFYGKRRCFKNVTKCCIVTCGNIVLHYYVNNLHTTTCKYATLKLVAQSEVTLCYISSEGDSAADPASDGEERQHVPDCHYNDLAPPG